MKGAEATYKQELKEQKEAAQAAKAARAATEADEHWGEAATEGYCRAWEMEICVCPAGTRPLAKRIPGERQLRCFECLRPYCGNMGAASDSGYQPNSPSTTAQPASDCTRNNAQKRNRSETATVPTEETEARQKQRLEGCQAETEAKHTRSAEDA